jgi:hypothetical protein
MDNPFHALTDAFQQDYRVNFSVERLDGSIMLTLSDELGPVAKRMISTVTLNNPTLLQRLIQSIKFGIAIERGNQATQMLSNMVDEHLFDQIAFPPALSQKIGTDHV